MPVTTSHPTSALKLALVALGIGLVLLVLANTFLIGRQATDENTFRPPPSRAYVTAVVVGTGPGGTTAPEHLSQRWRRDIVQASQLLPGDFVLAVDDAAVVSLAETRQALARSAESQVVAIRPGSRDLLSLTVPSAALSEALRSVENTVLVFEVTPGGASARAGMQVGDVITRINGQGFSTMQEADDVMRQSGADRETIYDILRGGEALSLNVRLAAFGVSFGRAVMVLVGLLYVLCGMALALLRAHIKAARYLGLAWMGVGVLVTQLLGDSRQALLPWVQALTDVFSVGGGLFGLAAWVHALHYFPRERTALIARRWVRPTVYTLAALGTATVLVGQPFRNAMPGVFILFVLVAAIATRKTSASYGAEEREILRPLTRSIAVALWTLLPLFVIGQAARGQTPLFVALLVALVVLAVLSVHVYVIGRYRLLEADLRLRRNVQYLLVSSAWTTAVAAAALWMWWMLVQTELPIPNVRLTGETIEILPTPVSAEHRAIVEKAVLISAAVVFAFGFRALLERGRRFLAEQYYREGYDYRKASQELSEVMGARMDLDGLADGLLTVIDRLMPVKKAGVAFVDGTRVFAARRSTGFDRDEWDVFCRGCMADALLALSDSPGEFDAEYAPPRLRLALRRSDIHYLYPVRGHNQLRGLIFIGEKLSESAYTADDFTFLNVIASQASLLVENSFLYENLAQQERAQQELAIARRIQLESLPQQPPVVAGLDVAGTSVPAQEVGGDYFDYLTGVPGTLGVMVGDVSGKGTSAALYMSKLQGIVRTLHAFELTPRDLFIRANDLLGRDLERRSFVTALGGFFDIDARVVTIARAGHLPLLRYEAATGEVHRHIPAGLGFGLVAGRQFGQELQEERVPYAAGDVFLFVSDGITESHAASGDDYGDDRLVALLLETAAQRFTAAETMHRIKASVDAFTEGTEQQDDQTIVVVRATGA